MEIRDQMVLGFDHMKAAIEGGHDLNDAWLEVMQMATTGKLEHVISGALACLQFCILALENKGLLTEIQVPEYNDFLHSGYEGRQKTILSALCENRFGELAALACTMSICIGSRRNHISFGNWFPEAT